MKKLAIAGASVALAAMPVVGVFAADTTSHTDTINISLNQVCTFGTVSNGVANDDDATAHNPTTTTSGFAGTWSGNTLSATLSAGNQYEALGTTTFTVRCNDASGYTITAHTGTEAGTLVRSAGDSNAIRTADGSDFAAATAGKSYWNFKLGSAGTGLTIAQDYDAPHAIPTTDTVVATAAANSGNLQTGQSVTVTYGAGIDNAQPTGTYTGTVVYTLNAL